MPGAQLEPLLIVTYDSDALLDLEIALAALSVCENYERDSPANLAFRMAWVAVIDELRKRGLEPRVVTR